MGLNTYRTCLNETLKKENLLCRQQYFRTFVKMPNPTNKPPAKDSFSSDIITILAALAGGALMMYPDQKWIGAAVMLAAESWGIIRAIGAMNKRFSWRKGTRLHILTFAFCLLALGFTAAKIISDPGNELEPKKIPTSIRMEFRGGPYAPDQNTPSNNIVAPLRTVTINQTSLDPATSDSVTKQAAFYIFLVFEHPIIYQKINMEFSRNTCPYSIIGQTSRYAVIMILGEIPAQTLSIDME